MPFVHVRRKPRKISEIMVDKLGKAIPKIIVRHLSFLWNSFEEKSVHVFFSDVQMRDVTTRDLSLVIQMRHQDGLLSYDLNLLAEKIIQDLLYELEEKGASIAVWIQLVEGGYDSMVTSESLTTTKQT
jgi:phenylpyruvate tautomerase PptA (4-oxalocrotonate tautomerase family)